MDNMSPSGTLNPDAAPRGKHGAQHVVGSAVEQSMWEGPRSRAVGGGKAGRGRGWKGPRWQGRFGVGGWGLQAAKTLRLESRGAHSKDHLRATV